MLDLLIIALADDPTPKDTEVKAGPLGFAVWIFMIIAVVIMIEMIFLMSVFAEIFTTTGGGPGNESTNVAFLIFKQALMNFDVGVASAGALFAVVLANIAAAFLIRLIGKNLDR